MSRSIPVARPILRRPNGGVKMAVLGSYAGVATVVGVALYVLATFNRAPEQPPPNSLALCAITAGLVWPVLVIGVAQGGLLAVLRHEPGRYQSLRR